MVRTYGRNDPGLKLYQRDLGVWLVGVIGQLVSVGVLS